MQLQFTFLMFFLWSIITPILAQSSFEMGGFIGISNYMGDLQQTTFEINEANPALGIFARINFNNSFSIKTHIYKGEVSGSDANYDGLRKIRARNLSFRSHLFEFGLQGELSFLWFGEGEERIAAPYIFAGFSGFHFNPQTRYEGKWIDLQPLGTEGQTLPASELDPYKLWQWAIPLGIGFNVSLSKKANIGFEVGFRKTFTDYLDDISALYPDIEELNAINPMAASLSFRTPEYTKSEVANPIGQLRGSSPQKDFYFFGGFTFSIFLSKWERVENIYAKR